MLEEISISNLGVLKQAKLPLTAGLTVLTGETGAGKTMVLTGLNLLTGKRASASTVRKGAACLSVEGIWSLPAGKLREAFEETGAVVEEDQLFINRTVYSDGKSRAVVGGKTTPAGVLSTLAADLVNIHGQADQLRLKEQGAQRGALDRFAGSDLAEKLNRYRALYSSWRREVAALKDLSENASARKREYNDLKKFIERYEDLAPEPNELTALEQTIERLENIDQLREGLSQALAVLAPEDHTGSALEQLDDAHRSLKRVSEYSADVATTANRLESILDQLADLESELTALADGSDGDSIQELYAAQERVVDLKAFVKKYGSSLEDVMEHYEEAVERLQVIDPSLNSLEELQGRVAEAETAMKISGGLVTEARAIAALKLAERVNEELLGLAMAGSKLSVALTEAPASSTGLDEVEFLLTHGGEDPRPLGKAASGGELSRIMLALEIVLADPTVTPTFVFDEVDSGVGGATAIEIGKRLALLAKDSQVIVVSHLAQVASFASNHLKVVKSTTDGAIETQVLQLSEAERTVELTRMLSGLADSASGQAHAEELLQAAESYKSSL